jgi:hypothetical protein
MKGSAVLMGSNLSDEFPRGLVRANGPAAQPTGSGQRRTMLRTASHPGYRAARAIASGVRAR